MLESAPGVQPDPPAKDGADIVDRNGSIRITGKGLARKAFGKLS